MNSTLHQKAMLVKLSISQWSARKYDKDATKLVATQFNTDTRVGRYNKALVSKEATDPTAKIASEARLYHYENTLPWGDDNFRLLPAANYMGYSQKMREFKSEFSSAASDFESKFPQYIQDAQSRLNGMFNPADYPPASEIGSFYSMEVTVLPLPTSEDFRVTMQESEVARIREDIEKHNKEAQETAMQDLWKRLYTAVENMAERLSNKDNIFRDSLVGNISELCGLLPKMNITDDPELERMRREIEDKLCGYEPITLRKDMAQRAQAAQDAKAIMSNMVGYMVN